MTMTLVIHGCLCCVLSCSILDCHILSFYVLSLMVLFCSILSYHGCSYPVLSCNILDGHVLSFHVLSWLRWTALGSSVVLKSPFCTLGWGGGWGGSGGRASWSLQRESRFLRRLGDWTLYWHIQVTGVRCRGGLLELDFEDVSNFQEAMLETVDWSRWGRGWTGWGRTGRTG